MKKFKSKKMITVLTVITALIVITALTMVTSKKPDQTLEVSTDSSTITISKSDVTKTASFYPYESNGIYMEIIAVRANDGTVRTALNTCQVCYDSGRGYYEQLGDVLICNNCGNQFTIDQIELIKGGCNPVPILDAMKSEDDDSVFISAESLVQFEPYFENWKR